MTFELWMLMGAAVLGLVHAGAQSFAYKAQTGHAYSIGPRDDEIPPKGLAGRLARAQRNYLETFPVFAAAVLIVHGAGRAGDFSSIGSALYLGARVLYLPAYALGIPHLRTALWQAAGIGIVMVLAQILI